MPPPVLTANRVSAGWVKGQPVVRDVDLTLRPGEVLGLQGPSGCGKSTLARVLALLHPAETGSVTVDGVPVVGTRHRVDSSVRTRIGVVFQQPRQSVDPRLTLHQIAAEPLMANGRKAEVAARVAEVAAAVGLTPDLMARRPHAVSDGQLQRACLARALVLRPRYLICDEMTTMLDASTTAALVHALQDYRAREHAGILAISHDHALLGRWADTVHTLKLPHPPHGAAA